MKIKSTCLLLLLPLLLCSCTYLKYSSIQAQYTRVQEADPTQVNLKHMIDRETFFVYGKTIDESAMYSDSALAIAAYSDKFSENERVDTMFFYGSGTHFGLHLPEGSYTLVVFSDNDGNGEFNHSEIIGLKEIAINETLYQDRIVGHADIELTFSQEIDWIDSIVAPEISESVQSLFYPSGAIRSLDDPIFNPEIATLGMYDPASFLEHAPTMFYALEEDLSYKIPVVFVHGIDGSSRSFKPIIEALDQDKYKPWFFYYPSGGDLDQLADFFYSLFLSSEIINLNTMPMVIVAHSMGGLVVREALNKYEGRESENQVELFITLASPLGGQPSAALGEEHGLIVLPAWRDLNPNNRFIKELYRKSLPDSINHQLLYAYDNSDLVKFGENSDGVVPLSSQLHPEAQKQSEGQFGFNASHTGILENEDAIKHIIDKLNEVQNIYSEPHLKLLSSGGYDMFLNKNYSPTTVYLIRSVGKYLMALVSGIVPPINSEQEHFVEVARGETIAINDTEKELLMFMMEYPEIVDLLHVY